MAGKKPSFITGATAKIKVGGKTFAYAQDVSYQVAIDTIAIETMGRYEAVTNEPVNYTVAGELSVVRYTKIANTNNMPGTTVAGAGNGLGAVTYTVGGNGAEQINPGNLLFSQTWDLSVYQKTQATAAGTTGAVTADSIEFITITDCRFTRKVGAINKRGILVDQLSFVGILASDDSFTASGSGDIDLS
jgi:hypothetical protein